MSFLFLRLKIKRENTFFENSKKNSPELELVVLEDRQQLHRSDAQGGQVGCPGREPGERASEGLVVFAVFEPASGRKGADADLVDDVLPGRCFRGLRVCGVP